MTTTGIRSKGTSALAGMALTPVAFPPLRTPPPQPEALPLVWRAQQRLKAAGFDPGPVDGTLGPKPRDALRWFQNTKQLPVTGDLDEATLGE